MAELGRRVRVGGPHFEDLAHGQVFDDAPSVTLTDGHAAVTQAIFGDRLRLPLDAVLCAAVTGSPAPLAHPMLVCNVVIGQSTGPSQRVRGNLFYRGLVLLRPVFIGDTLRTRTEVVGLKQNAVREGRQPTGLVALRVRSENQRGEPVLDFWRCPMLPLATPGLRTGHADTFDGIPEELDPAMVAAAVPAGWRLDAFRAACPGAHFSDLEEGTLYEVEGRDTVTCAPELARLTLNLAQTHTDAGASAYSRRLVYGGHTISIAAAQMVRALPNLVTILAWRGCDHLAPVFEEDVLRSDVEVAGLRRLDAGGGLVDLRVRVHATRAREDEQGGGEVEVLDWRLWGLMA
ncbi:MAG TPA: MaoC family dehydratase [Candidatus Dormibacteraeota bacterium]|nr:MaoC family dehydratase [Candidatus Dormibacteraeota bacterium]